MVGVELIHDVAELILVGEGGAKGVEDSTEYVKVLENFPLIKKIYFYYNFFKVIIFFYNS